MEQLENRLDEFSFISVHGVTLFVYLPWWSAGIVHGMTTRDLPCRRGALKDCAAKLCSAIGVTQLAVAEQCHGAEVLDLRDSTRRLRMQDEFGDLLGHAKADVVLAPLHARLDSALVAYGVMSADCVPILVRGSDGYAAIHAGWRGLACGVIRAGMAALEKPMQAVVFPAAGGERYEVGAEVIDAIGETAVYTESSNGGGKYLLDTARTAIRQLERCQSGIVCHSASLCTIEDHRFHSFRRDGEGAGRCVTFIAPGLVPRGLQT